MVYVFRAIEAGSRFLKVVKKHVFVMKCTVEFSPWSEKSYGNVNFSRAVLV